MGPYFMQKSAIGGHVAVHTHTHVHILIKVRGTPKSRRPSSAYKRQSSGELSGRQGLLQNTLISETPDQEPIHPA